MEPVNIWPAVFALAACVWLAVIGIRKLHNQQLEQDLAQAEWDAHYARKETEVALSVSNAIVNKVAERMAKVYGEGYIDYAIVQQIALPDVRQNYEAAARREAELKQRIEYYRQRDAERIAKFKEVEEDYCRLLDEEKRRRVDDILEEARRNNPRRNPPPRCQEAYFDQAQDWGMYHGQDFDNDDVLDVSVLPALQPLLPAASPRPSAPVGGRNRKYASDAERQAAYRVRRRARLG